MGFNLASDTISFFFISLLEFLFVLGSFIYFRIKKLKIKKEFKERLFPNKRGKLRRLLDFCLGVGMGALFYIIGGIILTTTKNIITFLFGTGFYEYASEGSVDVTPPVSSFFDIIIYISVNFLIVAFCEEFLFRGVLYRDFGELPKKRGILISSLLFSIYHVVPGIVPLQTTLTFFPYYFVIGLLFVLLLHYSNNDLLTSMIAHGTYNSIIILIEFMN